MFSVAHVLRRPGELVGIFCNFFSQKLSDKPLDDIISEFSSEHPELVLKAQHRMEHCERYTQYLNENGLYDIATHRLFAELKALREKWGWS